MNQMEKETQELILHMYRKIIVSLDKAINYNQLSVIFDKDTESFILEEILMQISTYLIQNIKSEAYQDKLINIYFNDIIDNVNSNEANPLTIKNFVSSLSAMITYIEENSTFISSSNQELKIDEYIRINLYKRELVILKNNMYKEYINPHNKNIQADNLKYLIKKN